MYMYSNKQALSDYLLIHTTFNQRPICTIYSSGTVTCYCVLNVAKLLLATIKSNELNGSVTPLQSNSTGFGQTRGFP